MLGRMSREIIESIAEVYGFPPEAVWTLVATLKHLNANPPSKEMILVGFHDNEGAHSDVIEDKSTGRLYENQGGFLSGLSEEDETMIRREL